MVVSFRTNTTKLPAIPWTFELGMKMKGVVDDMTCIIENLKELLEIKDKEMSELEANVKRISCDLEKEFRKNNALIDDVAVLYQDVENKDSQISNLLELLHKNERNVRLSYRHRFVNPFIACECCCMEVSRENVCKCKKNHVICFACINNACKVYREGFSAPKSTMNCLSMHLCDSSIDFVDICKVSEGRKLLFDSYIYENREQIQNYVRKFSMEEIEKNILFLRSDFSFRALQCPKCGYGPLIHEFCNDLELHHNEEHENGTIKNSCPNCKHFVTDTKFLENWNGYS